MVFLIADSFKKKMFRQFSLTDQMWSPKTESQGQPHISSLPLSSYSKSPPMEDPSPLHSALPFSHSL